MFVAPRSLTIVVSSVILFSFILLIFYWKRVDQAREFVQAAERGDTATVQSYLQKGMPADVRWKGLTALQFASYSGHENIASILLDHGADPKPALYQAVITRKAAVVELLLQRGADPDWKGKDHDKTPREIAIERKYDDIAAVMDKYPLK